MKRLFLIVLAASCLLSACEKGRRIVDRLPTAPIPFVILNEEGVNILELDDAVANEVYVLYGTKKYYPNSSTRVVFYPVELTTSDNIFIFGPWNWNAEYKFGVVYGDNRWTVQLKTPAKTYEEDDIYNHIELRVNNVITEKDSRYDAYVLQM